MTRPTALFSQVLQWRLDLAEATLNRVDRTTFFKRFQQHEAVQYFYEPFLEAFDPQLRKELGVWYTPDEVVRYMVERVDQALRNDLGIGAGLADSNVLILDPCCGTGAFLVAVLDRIYRTLVQQGGGTLAALDVVEAACARVYGFEILPAPFVIAHLQVSLYLESIKVRMPPDRRAAIYLTNALTGWEPAKGKQMRLWEGLREERDNADEVKRKAKVLVVLGNPPYNAFAGVQPQDEGDSVEIYKQGLGTQWRIRKFNLDDLYVRFLRLAERKIVEQSKRGVVCYISNASYVSDKSFVVLRDRFLQEFDAITIDNCNGDSRESGKVTPDGKPDPSIFSTARNREGIRVGTAVGLFVLKGTKRQRNALPAVRWREFWGEAKRQDMLASLREPVPAYTTVRPRRGRFWSFKPQKSSATYDMWPRIVELCKHEPISGLAEKRSGGLFEMSADVLPARIAAYLDPHRTWDEVKHEIGGLAEDAADYPARATREKFVKAGESFDPAAIRRYAFMPFDNRWCYWSAARPLWNRARPDLAAQFWEGNRALVLRTAARRPDEGWPVFAVSVLPDHHILDPNVVTIPFRWCAAVLGKNATTANLSERARSYLNQLGIVDVDTREDAATLLWYHVLSVSYSPEWLTDNGEAIRTDFPRIPMPSSRAALERSAILGRRVADLLDPEISVGGVTVGNLRHDLRPFGDLKRQDGQPLDSTRGDLGVAARWGARQRGSIVMPGPGRITRASKPNFGAHGLGPGALGVWLNADVCLEGVPETVWDFTIGGYQVIKKWLSYREKAVLGRDITLDEARHLINMVRRIVAVLLLSPELDAAYREARDNHTWSD